ncbi:MULTISPECIES: haloacid dehalogenase-like hydrolase [Aneurinibacillus]|uniref:phosphoserine phosphatase n=1 Tax=Aneurinibacillus thermoaerophilus TaxID=143495 RepID=A0A1G8AK03_ANETH|nr:MULTISPECIES: haloacid dehalogenase-like hydrolase [Aneurinibacillus]AMA71495.1 phosphoserine phosphatase [Aneurinibacillus sp. XH2]MED0675326.1 haloacid dehalogenase-like hydrolase [Aneurinibacillus thermoaerophilus]MED0678619.1 haloacid dehalogenase-like hydrolase [Aneurinibacillus thermoaerophilus]MED0738292.1 haloacid dehalogenase-like hydrolase [Aneurinibacillus thermoaerophilus]MED0756573.1 haloacid dehalogenase-like hydrolase [Aneurinibacillus thermoaerophilus]
MKKKNFLLGLGLTFSLLLTSQGPVLAAQPVQETTSRIVQNIQALDQGKWAPKNYEAIQALIDQYGIKNPSYNPEKKPYVIFDWDNTSIMHDTEEALFVYQINNLAFKMTPEEFAKVLRANVPAGAFSAQYKNADGKTITLEAIASDIESDYKYLYDHYKGFKGENSLEDIVKTDEFQDFRSKMLFLYEAIIGTHGSKVGYPWVLQFFTNMTTQEVQKLAEASNDYSLGDAIRKVTWTSPTSLAGNAGVVTATHITGIRLTPEIANLMNTFRSNGIDVYVVSASMEEVVEVFATNPKYGYNLPKENVIGMRLETNSDGKIIPKYKQNWFITVNHGKTEVIQSEIAKKRGYGPLFIAGDSDGDYEMMTEFPDTKLVLIINRVKDGNIGKAAARATETANNKQPKFILQGRDENTGMWIPSESTIRLGKSEPELLKK